MDRMPDEIFAAIFLDCKLNINGITKISHGSLNASLITMRELFKNALAYNAHSIIVAHNHPSGVPTPSSFDKTVTQNISNAAHLMDVHFYDHIIIADDQYFSFAENDMLMGSQSQEEK